jgi:capsular polysaccharide biosynthesis protein
MLRLFMLRFLESYFRHRFLNLLPIVLLIGVSVLSVLKVKPVYISRGGLYVQKESLLASLTSLNDTGFAWVTPAQATVDEFKEMLQTDAFIRSMIQQTDLETELVAQPAQADQMYQTVRSAVWVQVLGNNLIQIGATHGNGPVAHQLATATLETYLQWKINTAQQESISAQTFFSDLLKTYEADLEVAQQAMQIYLEDHPAPLRGDRPPAEQLEIDRQQANINIAAARLTSAQEKEESARLAMAQAESKTRQSYLIVDAPAFPFAPENSKKTALTGAAIQVVVGVILAVVLVVLGALIDRSLRFPIDVRHGLDLPVLAAVPDLMKKGKKEKKQKK